MAVRIDIRNNTDYFSGKYQILNTMYTGKKYNNIIRSKYKCLWIDTNMWLC